MKKAFLSFAGMHSPADVSRLFSSLLSFRAVYLVGEFSQPIHTHFILQFIRNIQKSQQLFTGQEGYESLQCDELVTKSVRQILSGKKDDVFL